MRTVRQKREVQTFRRVFLVQVTQSVSTIFLKKFIFFSSSSFDRFYVRIEETEMKVKQTKKDLLTRRREFGESLDHWSVGRTGGRSSRWEYPSVLCRREQYEGVSWIINLLFVTPVTVSMYYYADLERDPSVTFRTPVCVFL